MPYRFYMPHLGGDTITGDYGVNNDLKCTNLTTYDEYFKLFAEKSCTD